MNPSPTMSPPTNRIVSSSKPLLTTPVDQSIYYSVKVITTPTNEISTSSFPSILQLNIHIYSSCAPVTVITPLKSIKRPLTLHRHQLGNKNLPLSHMWMILLNLPILVQK